MERRKLGASGLEVSEMGLGCMGMSEFYGEGNEEESIATIHHTLDLGIDFLDTADVYGTGKNEELVGRAIKGKRDKYIIATKFGFKREGEGGPLRGVDGSPAYARQACEASLKRLNIETIDLYYLHRVDPNVPIEDTVGEMAKFVAEGKVRFLGLSEAAPKTIRGAHKVHPISALQNEYSLWTREPEKEIFPTIHELGIGFVPYSPLGRGFLTGTITSADSFGSGDNRGNYPRFSGENFNKNIALVKNVEAIAKSKGCTTAQIALAYVLAKGIDFVPIPGTKRRKYLDQNAAAIGIDLTESDIQQLESAMPADEVAGARYGEQALAMVGR